MTASTQTERIELLKLDEIVPSPFNYRDVSQTYLDGLAESIRKDGVMQPIVVRPVMRSGSDGEKIAWEIVFGECRWAASHIAEKETIPAVIRVLNNEEVKRQQLAENLHRNEPSAYETAMGIQSLTEEEGVPVAKLAIELGMSKSWIYNNKRAATLTGEAQQAFAKGVISLDVAALLGAYAEPLHAQGLDLVAPKAKTGERVALDYRQARQLVQTSLGRSVQNTPWNYYVPIIAERPSCELCPENTNNAPTVIDLLGTNVCLNPGCYQAKLQHHGNEQLQALVAEGCVAVTDEVEQRKLAKSGIKAAGTNTHRGPDQYQRKTWGELAELVNQAGRGPVKPRVFIDSQAGTVVQVFEPEQVGEILSHLFAIEDEQRRLDAQAQANNADTSADADDSTTEPEDEADVLAADAADDAERTPLTVTPQRYAQTYAQPAEAKPFVQQQWHTLFVPAIRQRLNGTERGVLDLLLILDFILDQVDLYEFHLQGMGEGFDLPWSTYRAHGDAGADLRKILLNWPEETRGATMARAIVCILLSESAALTAPGETQADKTARMSALALRYGVDPHTGEATEPAEQTEHADSQAALFATEAEHA